MTIGIDFGDHLKVSTLCPPQ